MQWRPTLPILECCHRAMPEKDTRQFDLSPFGRAMQWRTTLPVLSYCHRAMLEKNPRQLDVSPF
jgi:hypothetical protein